MSKPPLVIVPATARRAAGPVLVQPGPVVVAAVLAAPTRVPDQLEGDGRVGQQSPWQGRCDQSFGHRGRCMPAQP